MGWEEVWSVCVWAPEVQQGQAKESRSLDKDLISPYTLLTRRKLDPLYSVAFVRSLQVVALHCSLGGWVLLQT